MLFAIGAVVDTSNYDGVMIYSQQTELSGTFTQADAFDGLTLEHSDVVTGIRISVHTYQPSEEIEELYNDVLNGTAEVIFSEPHYDLSVAGGELVKHGDNYAVIKGTGETVILRGKNIRT